MNNKQFVDFCKQAQDKLTKYMWGDYGRPISTATITAKAKQYPDHYTAAYQSELASTISKGGIGCDCTGLIKWFLWTDGNIEQVPKYDEKTDNSASGWYSRAKVRGLIASLPEREGLILSYSGHCGVYIGNGQVIECTKGQFGNGVVQTNLTDRKWEKWCECVYIDYISEDQDDTEIQFKTVHVSKNCPAYSSLNKKIKIGDIYKEDEVAYMGDLGDMAAVIYPTAASYKIAFIEKSLIVL